MAEIQYGDAELQYVPGFQEAVFTVTGPYEAVESVTESLFGNVPTELGKAAVGLVEHPQYRTRPALLVGQLATWLDGR